MTPLGNWNYYAGIDPGHKGGIALMNAQGTSVRAWPMPVKDGEIDLAGLKEHFRRWSLLPKVCVGYEWPEAFPGSFGGNPRDNDRFGRQKGYLEAFAFLMLPEGSYCRVAPTLWKGRLGLDGKTVVGANDRAAALFRTFYPECDHLYHGPRGGLLDGPLDALLITHFMRTQTGVGMKSVIDKFGKDSLEAFAFMMGGARRKRKFGKRVA